MLCLQKKRKKLNSIGTTEALFNELSLLSAVLVKVAPVDVGGQAKDAAEDAHENDGEH